MCMKSGRKHRRVHGAQDGRKQKSVGWTFEQKAAQGSTRVVAVSRCVLRTERCKGIGRMSDPLPCAYRYSAVYSYASKGNVAEVPTTFIYRLVLALDHVDQVEQGDHSLAAYNRAIWSACLAVREGGIKGALWSKAVCPGIGLSNWATHSMAQAWLPFCRLFTCLRFAKLLPSSPSSFPFLLHSQDTYTTIAATTLARTYDSLVANAQSWITDTYHELHHSTSSNGSRVEHR
jgi:hypothetical protein